jgi:peptidylprolyl isomerase
LTRPEIDQIEACWDRQETHMTQASSGDTVRIHYTGKLTDGTLFDSSEGRDPLEFKIGENKIIPKLEESIVGMAVGDKTTVEVDAENAYGPRHEEAMQTVERSMVPDEIDLTVGNRLEATGPQRPVDGSHRRPGDGGDLHAGGQSPACRSGSRFRDRTGRGSRGLKAGNSGKISGAPTRTRTWDPLIKSQLLYRLSYGRTVPRALGGDGCRNIGRGPGAVNHRKPNPAPVRGKTAEIRREAAPPAFR